MEQKLEQNKVAVFFDYENIVYSLRNRFEQKANFDALIDKCNELGRVIVARVFADWSLSHMSSALLYSLQSSGFDLIFVPTGSTQSNTPRKNVADLYMAIHVMQTLYEQPDIQIFVLLTGDRDFMPLVNVLKRQGKRVVAIGVDGSSSFYLTQAVDEFFYYSEVEEIFAETPKRSKGRPTNIYDALVQTIQFLEEKGKSTTLAHIKPTMIELMDGFDESNYTDAKGRPFQRFKDFIMEAKRRGIVRLINAPYGLEVTVADQTGEKPVPMIETPDPEPVIISETGELTAVAAFELLARAVQLAQQEGKSFRASSIKSLIIRLHPGFDESEIENGSVRFGRFSDFVRAAANQKYVEVTGSGAKLEIRPNRANTPPLSAEPDPEPAPVGLTEFQVREAVLGALRSYNNYPTSFLSLANHCQRWCYNRKITLEESVVRLVLTESVELGLLTQNKRGDGKRQYEFIDQINLVERFLDLAVGPMPHQFDLVDLDDPEFNEFEVPAKPDPISAPKPSAEKSPKRNNSESERSDKADKKPKHPIVHPHKRPMREEKVVAPTPIPTTQENVAPPQVVVVPTPPQQPSAELPALTPQKPPFEAPTYQEYQQLNDQAEREFIVSALRSYGQYPSAFMAILAHCRLLRDAQQLYLPNATLRELLSESSRVGIIYTTTNRDERPTLYAFNDDVALIDLYVRQVVSDGVVVIPVSADTDPELATLEELQPVVVVDVEEPIAPLVEEDSAEPEQIPVLAEEVAPEKESQPIPITESTASPDIMSIDREAHLFVADALASFVGSAPFMKLFAYCAALAEEQGYTIAENRLRDAISTAARVGLLEITSRRGVRPTYYSYTGSESALVIYLGKITVPAEAEAVAEQSAEVVTEPIVEAEVITEQSAEVVVEPIVEAEVIAEQSAEVVAEPIVEAEVVAEQSAEVVAEPIVETEVVAEQSAEVVAEPIVELAQPVQSEVEQKSEGQFDNYVEAEESESYPLILAFELIARATQEATQQNASRRVAAINSRLHKLDPNFELAKVLDSHGKRFKKLSDLINAAATAGYIDTSGRGLSLELIVISAPQDQSDSAQSDESNHS